MSLCDKILQEVLKTEKQLQSIDTVHATSFTSDFITNEIQDIILKRLTALPLPKHTVKLYDLFIKKDVSTDCQNLYGKYYKMYESFLHNLSKKLIQQARHLKPYTTEQTQEVMNKLLYLLNGEYNTVLDNVCKLVQSKKDFETILNVVSKTITEQIEYFFKPWWDDMDKSKTQRLRRQFTLNKLKKELITLNQHVCVKGRSYRF